MLLIIANRWSDICSPDICSPWHLLTFSDICSPDISSPGHLLTRSFAHTDICSPRHLLTRTFAHPDNYSPGQLLTPTFTHPDYCSPLFLFINEKINTWNRSWLNIDGNFVIFVVTVRVAIAGTNWITFCSFYFQD